jgi:predicted ATPase
MSVAHAPLSPALTASAAWRVRLLGEVSLQDGQRRMLRLPSRAATALLARLALAPERAHAREELIELLWPGVALDVGRNRLRQVLSSLKTALEAGSGTLVISADRQNVRVAPGALSCDVLLFEAAWRSGRSAQARALYGGELMPGFYDAWIGEERLRLAALADRLPDAASSTQGRSAAVPTTGAAPAYLTRIYGRELDTVLLRTEVQQQRLVTLVGPGGAGKTRLAAELASAMRTARAQQLFEGAWPEAGTECLFDPVLFVPLVACTSRAEVLQSLGSALACEADLPALERALEGQSALLVLDNFEHLRELATDVVQALLSRLPHLHLLVTSRAILNLDGEREWVLHALSAPAPDLSLAEAAVNPAVALFVDRAGASWSGFQLDRSNLEAVLGLVRSLEGMPLALELAAARCRTLSPADMQQMLQLPAPDHDRVVTPGLDLLTRPGKRGDHDHRQSSMERVVGWSWDLLPVEAQTLLASLTVFRSSCSAAAVGSVCDLNAVQVRVMLDLLTSHSLLQVVRLPAQGLRKRGSGPSPSEPAERFQLLEVIREFAASRLPAARALGLRTRLRQWLIEWAKREGQTPLPARIEPELPNVHAVLLSAEGDGAAKDAMQLALALRHYWELDGMPLHSQQALERALQQACAPELHTQPGTWPDSLRCDVHELLAYTSIGAGGGSSALIHAGAALVLAGADKARRGRCLLRSVWVHLAIDYRAVDQEALLDEAWALALEVGDLALQARCLHQQGILARYQGQDCVHAEALFAQAQALWAALGNQCLAHARLRNRAQCWAAQGLHAQALESFRQCEQAARADGDWVGIIDSTLGAATALSRLRQWTPAVAMGSECIRVAWLRHHAHGLAYALWNIAHPMLRSGRVEDAVLLMSLASSYWSRHMGPLRADDLRDTAKVQRLARVYLGAQRVNALWIEGANLSVAEGVAIVLRR